MRTAFFLSAFLALLVWLQVSETAPVEKGCKEIQSEIMKKQMKGISQCSKSMNLKGKEKSKKMNCLIRCVMVNEGFLNPEGFLTSEWFDGYITKTFPSSIRSHFNTTMWNCMEMAFNGLKSPQEDAYCTSYDPFLKCTLAKAGDLCNGM